ncbi:restriction endonuclease subunit S, partial [Lactobacillus rodentium]
MYDWQQGKLGDKVNFYSGLTYKPENIQTNGVLVLRSSNIQNHHINLNDNIYVSPEVVNTTFVKKGDLVVVVRNGSKNLIGKHASIKEKMDNTVIGAFMTGIRSKDNFYIKALLDSDIFKKEIQKNLGATINQIITGNFKKMVFPFSSQEEEKSIGNLFTKLDETITLLQRKEKKYNDLKKALLQNIFPGNDQIIPILRFKEFNDEWQQSKLGEIMDVGSVKRIHQADWRNEGVRFLRARDIVALSKNEEPTDFLYIDNSKYNEYSKISGK